MTVSKDWKGVTLWQPWASMIAQGHKTIETRSWPTRHRGTLAIHAARRLEDGHVHDVLASEAFSMLGRSRQHLLLDALTGTRYPLGCIVATCQVVACLRIEQVTEEAQVATVVETEMPAETRLLPPPGTIEHALGDYRPGRYAWILEDVHALTQPVPCRGAQGLWDVDAQTRLDIAGALA